MIICSTYQISKMYGANPVFDKISLEIHDGDRVGLVGRNGSGKTTLFKLLAGSEPADEGEVHVRKGAKVGYLAQIPENAVEMTVKEVLRQPFGEVLATEKQMEKVAGEMAGPAASDGEQLNRLLLKYDELQQAFERNGGYEMESEIQKVINGLGIDEGFLERPFVSLSGGEQTKVGLAAALLEDPDLLLLDEPTNHLDLAAIEWLENFLRSYKGAVMLVSHDRYFLDRTVTRVFDLEDGELSFYQGDYTAFTKEKEERLLAEFQQYQEQQKKIKKMKEAIKRLREWANQANPPNAGLHRRASSMEKALERIEKIDRPILERRKIGLDLEAGKRSGRDVAVFEEVAKSFGERKLFDRIDMLVRYQERVAIIGENGTGKSTLIHLLLGELEPDGGSCTLGSSVKPGYLSQAGLEGYDDDTVLEAFRDQVVITEGQARQVLARFLFFGAHVFRKVRDLSGGEQMRLRLAQLMYQNVNFLVLDEPTNHLDIESREVLEDALQDFEGTILAVSHDRYFLNKLFAPIYWLENQCLTRYEGNYDEAKEKRNELYEL
ncbi:MAG TPA: ABC-F type ribosomal protection protein [Bacillales bacterium]|nr:ABC-F type ribosomal protection protein [Bacillales bacterium]